MSPVYCYAGSKQSATHLSGSKVRGSQWALPALNAMQSLKTRADLLMEHDVNGRRH